MSRKDKEALKKKIESYGGIYSPSLEMETTAVLITPTTEGDKYEYAKKWQIPCVGPDWVLDSIHKGHCLPTDQYRYETVTL